MLEKVKNFFNANLQKLIYVFLVVLIIIGVILLIPKKSLYERAVSKFKSYIEENNITLTNDEQYFSFETIDLKPDKNCFNGGLIIATNDSYKILYICDNEYSEDLKIVLNSNEIALVGQNPFYIKRGNFYVEPGYYEKSDLVIKSNDNIESKEGMYVVDYEAYGGNVPLKSKRIIIMTYDDFESYPIINLRGGQYVTVLQGRSYVEEGFEAYDSKDGSINNSVRISGNVNTSKLGFHSIKYAVTNSSGNTYEIIRNVNVIKDLSPINFTYTITPEHKAESVKINIKVSGNNYLYTLKPNNFITYLNDFDYNVTENGTYTFIIKKKDGDTLEKTITVSNIEKKSVVTSNFKDLNVRISSLLPYLDTSKYSMFQIATFAKGKIVETYSSGCSDNTSFYLSSASKTILGIVAAKMHEDSIVDLDSEMSSYWYRMHDYNFATCTPEWRSMMGPEVTIMSYTSSTKKLFQNPATLRNALTHSSTVKNMDMIHMVTTDPTSEYFGGSLSKTYGRAAFMLAHTSNQLFEKGKVPGRTTAYNYQNDDLTREHAMAGFTMQIAMKESINEYMRRTIFNKLNTTSNPGFLNGNSIYFAAGYKSSAEDVAKIVAAIANNGIYDDNLIFGSEALNQIKIVYTDLKNQTIAFDYNGKYFKYGDFSNINYFKVDEYNLSDMDNNYVSYISYDPIYGYGFVVTAKYNNSANKSNNLSTFNNTANYFYKNA